MKEKDAGMGNHPPKGKRPEMKPLSDDQKKAAKEILAKYDLNNLSKDKAKEVFKALEDGGIRGPGVMDVVKEAGVDPRIL